MKYPRQRRKAIRSAKNSTDQVAQLTGVTAASLVTLRAENVNDDRMTGDVPFGFLTGTVDGDAAPSIGLTRPRSRVTGTRQ